VRLDPTHRCVYSQFLPFLKAIYSLISPGWFITPIFGNDHFLFHASYFWFTIPLVVCIAIAPRYLYKACRINFAPDDLDRLRYLRKMQPNRRITAIPSEGGLHAFRRLGHRPSSRVESIGDGSINFFRPSLDHRTASRTDMATGIRSIHRGFDFSTEEGGVAIRRMQTNLSERRQSSRNLAVPLEGRKREGSFTKVLSMRRKFSKAKDHE
jgi:phospholipid-translocating ATPase